MKCGLRIGFAHYGAMKHCYKPATELFQGMMVCKPHKRELESSGTKPVYIRTN
jgi:hypothetical protein